MVCADLIYFILFYNTPLTILYGWRVYEISQAFKTLTPKLPKFVEDLTRVFPALSFP